MAAGHQKSDILRKCVFTLAAIALLGLLGALAGYFLSNGFAAKPRSWEEICRSGKLRLLVAPESEMRGLQRGMSVSDLEQSLLMAFASQHNLELDIVPVSSFPELFPALRHGKGDLIANNLTVTPGRRQTYLFTKPVFHTRELLLGRKDRDWDQLQANKTPLTLAIEKGTTYTDRLDPIRQRFPGLKIEERSDDAEDLISEVGSGRLDLTIIDDNYLKAYQAYRDDVESLYTFEGENAIAWALPKGATELQGQLDRFLDQELELFIGELQTGDLPAIRKRKTLRLLTRDNPFNYYIHRNQPMGFEYELAKRFADRLGVRLVVVTPPDWGQLIPYLRAGRGDLIASGMTILEERALEKGVVFCRPYAEVREVLVSRAGTQPPRSPRELAKYKITTRADSSYQKTLEKLKKSGIPLKIDLISPEVESFEILNGIADGKYDMTLVDNIIARVELHNTPELQTSLILSPIKRYGWMVRSDNPQLLREVNRFMEQEYRKEFYNQLYKKYFEYYKLVLEPELLHQNKEISLYDELIREVAAAKGFDWLLIAAQVCQESRFDSKVTANDGGMGLLQLMPATAAEMNCGDPFNPEQNLRAGVGYLAKLRDRFDDEVGEKDKIFFALASYNGGYGHLKDARRLAAERGLDPNRWFGHVEEAMLLLSEKKYYSKARYGFCRSDIITRYVRQIHNRQQNYLSMYQDK